MSEFAESITARQLTEVMTNDLSAEQAAAIYSGPKALLVVDGITVDRDSLVDFSMAANTDKSEQGCKNMVAGVWSTLLRIHLLQINPEAASNTAYKPPRLREPRLDFDGAPVTINYTGPLLLRSLVEVLRATDSMMADQPELELTDVLGTGAGIGKVLFLQRYAAFKVATLQSGHPLDLSEWDQPQLPEA